MNNAILRVAVQGRWHLELANGEVIEGLVTKVGFANQIWIAVVGGESDYHVVNPSHIVQAWSLPDG
jgi:hypothetical protein